MNDSAIKPNTFRFHGIAGKREKESKDEHGRTMADYERQVKETKMIINNSAAKTAAQPAKPASILDEYAALNGNARQRFYEANKNAIWAAQNEITYANRHNKQSVNRVKG
jgi:hypothetical protein